MESLQPRRSSSEPKSLHYLNSPQASLFHSVCSHGLHRPAQCPPSILTVAIFNRHLNCTHQPSVVLYLHKQNILSQQVCPLWLTDCLFFTLSVFCWKWLSKTLLGLQLASPHAGGIILGRRQYCPIPFHFSSEINFQWKRESYPQSTPLRSTNHCEELSGTITAQDCLLY